MEDSNSMINMPNLFDEKVGNKRVRDGEEEIHQGRLEKRPSGILSVSNGGDRVVDGGGEAADDGGSGGGGIFDTFFSNVFHNNKNDTKDELEVGGENEDKREDLGGNGGGNGGGEGGESGSGGGVISSFFSNIFQNNGSVDDGGDQVKSDHLVNEVDEKTGRLGGGPGDGGGGGDGEPEGLKKDEDVDLPSKDTKGPTPKLKLDDYAERVFFLNNN